MEEEEEGKILPRRRPCLKEEEEDIKKNSFWPIFTGNVRALPSCRSKEDVFPSFFLLCSFLK